MATGDNTRSDLGEGDAAGFLRQSLYNPCNFLFIPYGLTWLVLCLVHFRNSGHRGKFSVFGSEVLQGTRCRERAANRSYLLFLRHSAAKARATKAVHRHRDTHVLRPNNLALRKPHTQAAIAR